MMHYVDWNLERKTKFLNKVKRVKLTEIIVPSGMAYPPSTKPAGAVFTVLGAGGYRRNVSSNTWSKMSIKQKLKKF